MDMVDTPKLKTKDTYLPELGPEHAELMLKHSEMMKK